jgi:prepilin-type N-terminal cleavage/methylation domain-containing protein
MRRFPRHAFTLVELLVVIGIIAVLISVLLPALGKARESANAIKCAANLRSIGQGLLIYAAENKSTFPAAYYYNGMAINGRCRPRMPPSTATCTGPASCTAARTARENGVVNASAYGMPSFMNDAGGISSSAPRSRRAVCRRPIPTAPITTSAR